MPYSTTDDMLTGNIPAPAAGLLSPAKFVNDAADEIDAAIGHIYQTPVDMTEEGGVSRPARLVLKRISNFLASGRYMMAAAAGSQLTEIHAYALKLVEDATASLDAIARGDVVLEGAVRLGDQEESFTGPQIYNEDTESNVEAFYNRVANPNYSRLPVWRPATDGLIA